MHIRDISVLDPKRATFGCPNANDSKLNLISRQCFAPLMLFVSLSKIPQAYGLAMPVTHKLWDAIKCQVNKKVYKNICEERLGNNLNAPTFCRAPEATDIGFQYWLGFFLFRTWNIWKNSFKTIFTKLAKGDLLTSTWLGIDCECLKGLPNSQESL